MSQTAVAEKPTNIVTAVTDRVESLVKQNALILPKEYPYQNAIREAMFIIGDIEVSGKSAFEICKPASIQEALFRMVCQALVPSKEQCYFIPYGDKLTMRRSYFGSLAVARRVAGVKDAEPMVIHAGDKFKHEVVNGKIVSISHEQELENLDNEIVGAYCFVEMNDGTERIDLMTIKQIKQSWSMAKGDSSKNKLQNQFGEKAAERTVMNRALKKLINTSNDANLYEKFDDEQEIEETSHEVVSSVKTPEVAPKVVGLPSAKQQTQVPAQKDKPQPVPVENQQLSIEEPEQTSFTEEDPNSWK